MAVNAEEFYSTEVEVLINVGNKMLASQFKVEIDGCPNLSNLIVTCNPSLPGRWPVEDIPGGQGVTINEPGPKKTGGQFTLTFQDGVKGPAMAEYKAWEEGCADPTKRKTVRIFQTSEFGDGELDVSYDYAWPDMEEGDFDKENKTPGRLTCNLHFANRRWTN